MSDRQEYLLQVWHWASDWCSVVSQVTLAVYPTPQEALKAKDRVEDIVNLPDREVVVWAAGAPR